MGTEVRGSRTRKNKRKLCDQLFITTETLIRTHVNSRRPRNSIFWADKLISRRKCCLLSTVHFYRVRIFFYSAVSLTSAYFVQLKHEGKLILNKVAR